ncbi:MAG TPA: helix-hairpin-helix domain-containing protein [Arachnia sp.]|nr:helix-hairpin-helix domain-containing protein [Arachnia sp.]HMT85486.1 helix-hairpin-helix domain-containing protein [Arachnia sp.]
MRSSSSSSDELVRARLAYVSLGQPPLGGPRRAAEEPETVSPPGAGEAVAAEAISGEAAIGGAAIPGAPPAAGGWLSRLELSRRHLIAAAVLVACGVVLALVAIGRTQAIEVELAEPVPSSSPMDPSSIQPSSIQVGQPAATESEPSPAPRIRVHVLGGVTAPGVVTLDDGAIVADAIAAAGGLTEDARPGQLNLAERVADGMQVLVGVEGQDSEVSGASPGGTGSGDRGSGMVNLNTASQAQLEELPGVGPVTAAAIIAWRERSGGFGSVAELQEVDGIGPKTFAKLAPLVTT